MIMENLPKDPFMLMSAVNMKLRDFYPSLDALCDDQGIDRAELEKVLGEIGFEYNKEQNRFW